MQRKKPAILYKLDSEKNAENKVKKLLDFDS